MHSNFFQELKQRGLVHQTTDERALEEQLNKESVKLYVGFDPTADSLHIGHLLPILMLRRFQQNGHVPIALVGAGTGMIGDPSFKDQERQLNPLTTVQEWSDNVKKQLAQFIDFNNKENPAIVDNNYDWLGKMSMIDFLRDVGKNFTINYMMNKESVKRRIDSGISYTEFAYQLLQAYDFLKLYQKYSCLLQLGGSDQWGNITSGIELLHREEGVQGFGLTMPLITKADGKKFGKTEGNAIWLDANKTSPYEFYQFWLNTDDRDAVRFLKYFTFFSLDEIAQIEEEFQQAPETRVAQKALAKDVTTLVHGQKGYEQAKRISEALFSGSVKELNTEELDQAFGGVPAYEVGSDDSLNLVEILIAAGIDSSKRQAREDINNGAIYLNGDRIQDTDYEIQEADKLGGKTTVIRRGKKRYFLLRF
ncbi:tyrosine--tRNA ligase [Tetragenococcus halophilus]|uniref:Tyrosine--tRNA ligase n=1 Tax=Tetragenococcus halophilus (strain DSM 20338 / JCM 20259 / NCIMB 9735 / NBRC 12172) TaxID=945021 RepID=A0AAN1SHB9_TETHN|nr:tyrosine--tRNA ligase [Tetragenococcus halophilus]MCO7025697.1 tyrosine--tRNA ligase [Tetragenococcus halophilus]BAK95040.1 tyrosyl-tRNA synthetase [Tetragenococcus halophilus NBRC 12172]GBD70972.1 tyrosyl-tRNA synthetase [Tetragenococcus halophilus subsp. halophilus]GBD79048.1 tyrosyl-tRNA synthetase [Tetragenococcus halophilus subsp. halophilus]GFK29186.1 tyrosyl-tRNA synthetase [Tetragenococcus halophilus]